MKKLLHCCTMRYMNETRIFKHNCPKAGIFSKMSHAKDEKLNSEFIQTVTASWINFGHE